MTIFSNLSKSNIKRSFKAIDGIKNSKPFSRLIKCKNGVGAIEFALVFPFLLILYVGALELSVAMSINKKLVKANAITTDLVSQSTSTNKAALKEMLGVAKSIITPFDSSSLKLQVIGISVDRNKIAKVAWSWNEKNQRPWQPNFPITIPKEFLIPDTFIMQTTANLQHNLLMVMPEGRSVGFIDRSINMQKVYYLHQREAAPITCHDC